MTDADGNMSPAEIVVLTVAGAAGLWIIVEFIDNIHVLFDDASQWCSNRSGEIVDGPLQDRLSGPYCELPNGTVVDVPRVVETSPPSTILPLETAIIVAFVLLVATIVYGYAGGRADD